MTRGTLRASLLALALLFLVWEAYGAVRWISHAGGIVPAARHFWAQLHSDWMLLVAVSDLLLVAAIALVALWADAMRRGVTLSWRVFLAGTFIAFGSPVILCYLAWRLKNTADSSPAAVSPPGSA